MSTRLVYAREQGIIPWIWVVDETREAERIVLWADADAIIDAAVRGYRRDDWQDQPRRVQVWSDKGTVRGTLAPVLKAFGVTFKVMHGYLSDVSRRLPTQLNSRIEELLPYRWTASAQHGDTARP